MKIHITNVIKVLRFQMYRWMLPHRDMWIACEHGGVQMDTSMEAPIAACEHPGITLQMNTEAEGLAEVPE